MESRAPPRRRTHDARWLSGVSVGAAGEGTTRYDPRVTTIPLGPFELSEVLGTGGMGEVWKGVHRTQGVEVAVKVVSSEHLADERRLRAFRTEVRATAGLDHPSIVKVFDFGTVGDDSAKASGGRLVGGSPYLAMELAEGGSLWPLRGRLRWRELWSLLSCLLDALAHAHARGVIHRDLKPGNVLLRESDGSAVLIDFGLCRSVDDVGVTRPGNIPGTTGYIAPEVIRSGELGPAADQYALGILLFGMRTGQHPFGRREAGRMLFAHLEERPPTLAQLGIEDPQLDAVIQRCLYKTPQARFASLAELREALEEKPVEPACPEEAANNPMRTVLLVALLFLSMGLLGMESL